jgi:predicted ArsR family transcriptional regulator
LAGKARIEPEKTREMQERSKERNLIVKEIKKNGSMTVEELANATGIEKPKVLKHLIAMTQFGKVQVVGERQNQFAYGLPPEKKT